MSADTHAQALEEFQVSYGSGADFESDGLAALIIGAGRFVELVVGPEATAKAMCALLEALDLQVPDDPRGWPEFIEFQATGDAFSSWPMGTTLYCLNAYGYWGLCADPALAERDPNWPTTLLASALALLDRTPPNWEVDLGDVRSTIEAAKARWALDNFEPLEPGGLALIGRASPKTVRNLISNRSLVVGEDGKVPHGEALAWLEARKDFRPSLWRHATAKGEADHQEQGFIFLPVARDGSFFHPGTRRRTDAPYTIGPKGAEELFDSFEEALTRLQQMSTPYWRRPNPAGNWGIVAGVRWERVPVKRLQELSRLPATQGAEDA